MSDMLRTTIQPSPGIHKSYTLIGRLGFNGTFNKIQDISHLILHLLTLMQMFIHILECGPMPNMMAALPNIGGALFNAAVSLTPTNRVPCSNAAKTRNPLKLAGMPQTTGPISAASGPKYTIL